MTLKNKIRKLEKVVKPAPSVLTAHNQEEAKEKLEIFNREFPKAPDPKVLIGDKIEKPVNAGLGTKAG